MQRVTRDSLYSSGWFSGGAIPNTHKVNRDSTEIQYAKILSLVLKLSHPKLILKLF